ncbi:MAG: hypothetical protein ACOC5A_01160 [Halanaerobiales bacterium]
MGNCGDCKKQCGSQDRFLVKEILNLDREFLSGYMSKLQQHPGIEGVRKKNSKGKLEVFFDDRLIAPEEIKDFLDK